MKNYISIMMLLLAFIISAQTSPTPARYGTWYQNATKKNKDNIKGVAVLDLDNILNGYVDLDSLGGNQNLQKTLLNGSNSILDNQEMSMENRNSNGNSSFFQYGHDFNISSQNSNGSSVLSLLGGYAHIGINPNLDDPDRKGLTISDSVTYYTDVKGRGIEYESPLIDVRPLTLVNYQMLIDAVSNLNTGSLIQQRFDFDLATNPLKNFTLTESPTQIQRITITNSDIYLDESDYSVTGNVLTILSNILKDDDIVRIDYWTGTSNTSNYSKLEADALFYDKQLGENLENTVYAIADGTGGKAYISLTAAMAVLPLPVNGTIFTIDASNVSQAGVYAYDSSQSDGYRFVKSFGDVEVNGEIENGNLNAVSGDTVYEYIHIMKNSGLYSKPFTITNQYINKTTGAIVNSTQYRLSSFITVATDDLIIRKGGAISMGSSTAEIFCFDENSNYIGFHNQFLNNYEVLVSALPVGTVKIRVNSPSSYSGEYSVHTLNKIKLEAVEGTDKLSKIDILLTNYDGYDSENVESGYISAGGSLTLGSTSWKLTKPIKVSEGMVLSYTGYTTNLAYPIWGYDEDLNPVASLLSQGTYNSVPITIPSGISYVRASGRNISGDVNILQYSSFNEDLINVQKITENYKKDFFIPKNIYAKSGESISFNINGIVNKHPKDYSADVFFNYPNGNEDFLKITPTTNFSVPIRQRLPDGTPIVLGNMAVKVTTTVVSPSTPQYFIHLGDSTVKGVASSNVEGAIVNELSRRLTGVGFELTPGINSPSALSLTNIYFLGRIGDKPIKHEGFGGTSWQNHMGTGSPFWNTSSGSIDIPNYLATNSFTGVTPTGSNLTLLVQLGWNDVFNFTPAQIEANCKTFLDRVKASQSDIRVKLISMQLPPPDVFKNYSGTREQSYVSTMQKVMLIARIYEKIADESVYSGWVEHISYMPTFFPSGSYVPVDVKINNRSNNLTTQNADDVHPNAIGYAQMADTLFYNILYNYCRP